MSDLLKKICQKKRDEVENLKQKCSLKSLKKLLPKKNNKRLCENCENNTDIQSLKNDFAVRIKIPIDAKTEINDEIQGCIRIENKELDNIIS